jgi:hypothetical protein
VLLSVAFIACSRWSLDTYWESDGYRLIAIDTKSQMSLIFEEDNITLVGPTIFAVGADERYIVLKQHPALDQHASVFDRSVTNYFIVERTRSQDFRERKRHVKGPMKREEFEILESKLTLPAFTKTFDDLQ